LRFEELAEAAVWEGICDRFIEILLEAASSPPSNPSSVPVLNKQAELCNLGQGYSRALRSFWLDWA
jgi:hypothetical protein